MAYRYHDEAVTVLAAQAPDLHEALQRAKAGGMAYVILDGKIFSADRCSEKTTSVKGTRIDLWYSGKDTNTAATCTPCPHRTVPAVGGRGRARLRARPDRGPRPRLIMDEALG
jgi:hypothetical protein